MFERIMNCVINGRTKDSNGDMTVYENGPDRLFVTSCSPDRGTEFVVLVFNGETVSCIFLNNYFDLHVHTSLRYEELDMILQTMGDDVSSVHLKNVSYRTLNRRKK